MAWQYGMACLDWIRFDLLDLLDVVIYLIGRYWLLMREGLRWMVLFR